MRFGRKRVCWPIAGQVVYIEICIHVLPDLTHYPPPSVSTHKTITLCYAAKAEPFKLCVLGGRRFVGPLLSGPTNSSSSRIRTPVKLCVRAKLCGRPLARISDAMGLDFEALGRGIGEGLVWDWLGITEGLVSLLRDWSKLGKVFVRVF